MFNRRGDGAVHSVWGRLSAYLAKRRAARAGGLDRRRGVPLPAFALGLLLALFCAPLFAQTAPTDYVVAKSVTPIGPSGGMYLGQGNFIANGKYIPAGYYKAPISYNPATIGKLAGKVLGHAIRLAAAYETIKDLYDLAHYLYDPSTGTTSKGGYASAPCSSGFTYTGDMMGGGIQTCGAIPIDAHIQAAFDAWCYNNWSKNGWGSCTHDPVPTALGASQYAWHYRPTRPGYLAHDGLLAVQIATYGSPFTEPGVTGTPVTDAQVYDLVKDNPQTMHDLLHDPEGNIIRTPEVVAAEDTLGVALHDKYAVPTTVGDGGSAIDLGVSVTSPTTTTTNPDSLPAFCGWASAVCDFMTWYKTPPVVDAPTVLPEKDPGLVAQSWSSGQGAGSCPAPTSVSVDFIGTSAPIEFSYQPLCDLAGLLHGLVIAASLLIAAYIISGTRNV